MVGVANDMPFGGKMKIKNIAQEPAFTAADGSRITETFGLPSEGIAEASIAYAVVESGKSTEGHAHDFTEWYFMLSGEGLMRIDAETSRVGVGDHILIPRGRSHTITTCGTEPLTFYCICVPAFTLTGTHMADGSKAREEIARDFTPRS